jgi:hypothetical protein
MTLSKRGSFVSRNASLVLFPSFSSSATTQSEMTGIPTNKFHYLHLPRRQSMDDSMISSLF